MVEIEHTIKYINVLADFLDDGKVEILWKRNGAAFRVNVDLESELSQINEGLSESEFLQTAFDVFQAAKAISHGEKENSNVDEEWANIVSQHFIRNDKDLIDYILIHSTSAAKVLNEIDYEILTKRNKVNPTEVLTHSILINIFVNDVTDKQDESPTDKLSVELTKAEIEELMQKCNSILGELSLLDDLAKE